MECDLTCFAATSGSTLATAAVVATGGASLGAMAAAGAVGAIGGGIAERAINHDIKEPYRTDAGTFTDRSVADVMKGLAIEGALGGVTSAAGGAASNMGGAYYAKATGQYAAALTKPLGYQGAGFVAGQVGGKVAGKVAEKVLR